MKRSGSPGRTISHGSARRLQTGSVSLPALNDSDTRDTLAGRFRNDRTTFSWSTESCPKARSRFTKRWTRSIVAESSR